MLQSSEGNTIAIDESDDTPIMVTTISFADTAITPATTDPYTILNEPPGVSIDADGVITATIDYDALSQIQRDTGLSMVVQGENSVGDIGVIILTVTVVNLDDEAPVFDSPLPSATIVSGETSFQGGALAISATDDLGGEIAYAFVNSDGTTTAMANGFAIDGATGAISVTTAPTFSHADPAANRIELTVRATDTSTGAIGDLASDDAVIAVQVISVVDSDNDGLIDINTLEALNNIRYNLEGTSYKVSADGSGSSEGCPATGCFGYELMGNLDFEEAASYAAGDINSDWRPDNADPDMATNAGWEPIGSCNTESDVDENPCGDDDDTPFAAMFEGNGYTISNLYTRGAGGVGLFGITAESAEIRNVGVVGNNSYGGSGGNHAVGGLVGSNNGEIIASHATGDAEGGSDDFENVGGLVGRNGVDGNIIASYATGNANGGSSSAVVVGALVGENSGEIIASYATGDADISNLHDVAVGGLVGLNNGEIIASYATGDADGGDGNSVYVGGLVGWNVGEVIASYATGDAETGPGESGRVGGLVGVNDGEITTSYAIGDADSGGGNFDLVGALVSVNNDDAITASYGFGDVAGAATVSVDRDAAANQSIHSPAVLTATNSSTMPANQWDKCMGAFGNDRLYPVVKWVTSYDATAETFSCVQTMLPDGQTCGDPLPDQYDSDDDGAQDMVPAAPSTPTAAPTVSTITITWTALADPAITAYRVYRNATEGNNALGNRPIATVAASEPLTYTDSAPLDGENYYAVSAVNVAGEGARSPSASAERLPIDSDNDGLIDINTLEELNNIRYNLEGTSYKVSADGSGISEGCPATGCDGYELMRNLDFADAASYAAGSVNSDWRPDNADPDMATNAGWEPIGSCNDRLRRCRHASMWRRRRYAICRDV